MRSLQHEERTRRIDLATGIITRVIGIGYEDYEDYEGYGGDGGPAKDAVLSWGRGIAITDDGVLYFADECTSRIRRVQL